MRSAAALALLAFVLAGCAKERPSALSIAACLRDQGASVRTATFQHYSPPGVRDDWTGVAFVSYSTLDRDHLGPLGGHEAGYLIVARSDPDARRLARELQSPRLGAGAVPVAGSVLYTATPLARSCL